MEVESCVVIKTILTLTCNHPTKGTSINSTTEKTSTTTIQPQTKSVSIIAACLTILLIISVIVVSTFCYKKIQHRSINQESESMSLIQMDILKC